MIFVCNSAFARRSNPRGKACHSNLRVIQGAIEMYNMDSSQMIEYFDENTIKELIKGKYLKQEPYKYDTSCEYKTIGNFADEGILFCKYHGDSEELIYCDYFKDNKYHQYLKLPQNVTYEELKASREKIKQEKERLWKRIQFKEDLKYYGLLIGIPLAILLLIFTIIPSKKKARA